MGAWGRRVWKAGYNDGADGRNGAKGAGPGGAAAVGEAGQGSWLACAGLVQGRGKQPQDPKAGRLVAGGEGVVSSLLNKRKTEVSGQLVALVSC